MSHGKETAQSMAIHKATMTINTFNNLIYAELEIKELKNEQICGIISPKIRLKP
ncbi:hypothetical protein [Candidatus Endolissoclinum faulkneri]|uniref:hypothetical protein n=1 Tax=Candidatus Endolissoclinum faulkneri TaxID=1263979 RepID=UPI0004298E40|nr:hypothetical protein [Candidatus Endolissoclinum faulkneri]